MPQIKIEEFDEAPDVGDKVTVTGRVKSIDEDNGIVEVSYDKVTTKKKSKKSSDDNEDDNGNDNGGDNDYQSDSLDAALMRAFPATQ